MLFSQPVISPQREPPFLFVPWTQVAGERGLPIFHKDGDSCPHEDFDKVLAQKGCLIPGEKELFLQANEALFQHWKNQVMPLENIAQDVLDAIYYQQQTEWSWNTLLWAVAERNQYWIGYDALPAPIPLQINCGGLGGVPLTVLSLRTSTAPVPLLAIARSTGHHSRQPMS